MGQVNGNASREAALVGSSPDYALNFDLKDIADLTIAELTLPDAPKLSNGTYAFAFPGKLRLTSVC